MNVSLVPLLLNILVSDHVVNVGVKSDVISVLCDIVMSSSTCVYIEERRL